MTQYIILVSAKSIDDVIPVENELAVAKYWLEVDRSDLDSWRKFTYRCAYAISCDFILDWLTRFIWQEGLKGFILDRAYKRLKAGYEYSNFCWGNQNFAKNYFE